MIRREVVKKIDVITAYLFDKFAENFKVNLNAIAEFEGLLIHYDDYDDAFDGMFVIDDGIHHIHLNVTRGNFPNSGRGRFSLAHEFGHYLIEDHHEDILSGKLQPHPSFQTHSYLDKYEAEADFFAANLLMPKNAFYDACGGRPFSWKLIEYLAETFGTSKIATLRRFIKTTSHEIIVIGSSVDGVVNWFDKNEAFPKMKHKFRSKEILPPNALAHGFSNGTSEVIEAMPEDWFVTWGGRSERELFEQCYFSDAYQNVITMLWYK